MTFGEFFWSAVVLYFIIMFIAMFITSFGDVLRRKDLSGWGKAGWLFVFVMLPFVGILAYVIVRPKSADVGTSVRSVGEYPSDRAPMMGMRP